MDNLHETLQYLRGVWLPNNTRYEQVPFVPAFEYYDERLLENSDNSKLDYYIPIQERSSEQ